MLWLIDTCQNRWLVSRNNINGSGLELIEVAYIFDRWPGTGFSIGPCYYSREEGGNTCKGKFPNYLWRVVDFLSDIFLAQPSRQLEKIAKLQAKQLRACLLPMIAHLCDTIYVDYLLNSGGIYPLKFSRKKSAGNCR